MNIPLILITSDKVYKPLPQTHYEHSPLGGIDPYSASKSCCEIIANSYIQTFNSKIITARAGNVLGAYDYLHRDRLLMTMLSSVKQGRKIELRNPSATRPFQYVMDVVWAYVLLGKKVCECEKGAFNIGPRKSNSVWDIVMYFVFAWTNNKVTMNENCPDSFWDFIETKERPTEILTKHEVLNLEINPDKIETITGWKPLVEMNEAIRRIIELEKGHGSLQSEVMWYLNKAVV
jgi:CDP-glucose 4,6-dehydratase